jgi:hypothetical protein
MQDQLDNLAALLGRSVSVDSPSGRLLGYSVQSDDADEARIFTILARQVPEPVRQWQDEHGLSTATGPVRLPANRGLRMTARLCLPLRQHGVLRAYLWIVEGATALTPEEVAVVADHGRRVLARLPETPAPAGTDALSGLFRDLVAPAPVDDAERLVGAMVDVAPDLLGATVRLAVGLPVSSPPSDGEGRGGALSASEAARLARGLGALAGGPEGVVTSWVTATRVVVVCRAEAASRMPALASLVAPTVLATGTGPAVPFDAPGLLHGLAMADFTAACVAADPRLPRDLAWEQLGVYRLLSHGDPPPWLQTLAPLDEQGASGDTLLDTLETYLDLAGDAQRTAAELMLHRTTLYYRLNRAASQLGGDLGDGLWRTALHVSLKARRLARSRG